MIKLFNSLTKKIEEFKPIVPGQASIYSCGPTVYNYIHIGNARSFLTSDLLVRTLTSSGLKTKLVMNVTDVDDKTINGAQKEKKSLAEFTEFYTSAFVKDMQALNVEAPQLLPKASAEIGGMVELIENLLKKEIAYKTANGDIYFSIAKFAGYGKLANLDAQTLKTNAAGRLSTADEYEKENARDFALWKAHTSEDGDVFWETPIGKGRPGWHIECSAMSAKYLGQPFDIHTGGVDLIFPHHTNEIAQSEAATGQPLANYWIHAEHLLIDSAKMAKSADNFFTLKDVLDKGFNPLSFRYLILTTHYRSKLNFSWDSLTGAQNALNNLYQMVSTFDPASQPLDKYAQAFTAAIENDLDTPKATAVMWDMVKSEEDSGAKLATLFEFDKVLGLKIEEIWTAAKAVPDVVRQLIDEREAARKAKDFAKSDDLRKAIESNGYIIEDTPDGVRVKKKF